MRPPHNRIHTIGDANGKRTQAKNQMNEQKKQVQFDRAIMHIHVMAYTFIGHKDGGKASVSATLVPPLSAREEAASGDATLPVVGPRSGWLRARSSVSSQSRSGNLLAGSLGPTRRASFPPCMVMLMAWLK